MKLLLFLLLVAPQDDPRTELRKQIEELSIDQTWSRVPWKTCPIEAFAESRKTGKPVLVWALGGDPEGRC